MTTKVLQPGLNNQATGSAYIETEKTKIACAVYGVLSQEELLLTPQSGMDPASQNPLHSMKKGV